MKLILTISAMILFLITGCESGKQPANDFLTVDITANYPKKELILQDFLDVEYIPLETNLKNKYAITYTSGYASNCSTLLAMMGKEDIAIIDMHSSL